MKPAIIKKNRFWHGFRRSPTTTILFAELKDTDLIKKYKGDGKGFAIVTKQNDGKWIVTDILYKEDEEPIPTNAYIIPVLFNFAQVYFDEKFFHLFESIYYDVKNYS